VTLAAIVRDCIEAMQDAAKEAHIEVDAVTLPVVSMSA
jgi:hypothetical protein